MLPCLSLESVERYVYMIYLIACLFCIKMRAHAYNSAVDRACRVPFIFACVCRVLPALHFASCAVLRPEKGGLDGGRNCEVSPCGVKSIIPRTCGRNLDGFSRSFSRKCQWLRVFVFNELASEPLKGWLTHVFKDIGFLNMIRICIVLVILSSWTRMVMFDVPLSSLVHYGWLKDHNHTFGPTRPYKTHGLNIISETSLNLIGFCAGFVRILL